MKSRQVVYWIATGVLVLPFGVGGVADILQPDPVKETFEHLGYPAYMATIIGVAKLLGLAMVLAPRLPRLKEWAYAGFAIDVLGAFFSHLAVGDSAELAAPLIVLAITLVSWWLRPAERRLV